MGQPLATSLGSKDDLFWHLYDLPQCAGRALIVGSKVYKSRQDRRRHFGNVVGVDMLPGEGVDRVLDMERALPADLGQFDYVECVSVLEHSRRPWLLAANVQRCMRTGATLLLSVPFVWRIHAYPDDYYRFTPAAVRALFPRIAWQALYFRGTEVRAEDQKVKAKTLEGVPYFERTEVVGVGHLQ